jgi:hypothetical protein
MYVHHSPDGRPACSFQRQANVNHKQSFTGYQPKDHKMPAVLTPRSRAERRRWARHIGNDIRASLPWWQFAERFRIGTVIDRFRTN